MTVPSLISAVIPSLNQGTFIARAVRSLLAQDDPALEILVIDGGSSDRTRAELEPFRNRLAAFVSEPDGGQADALRKGFTLARGDLFCWLNADDVLLPGALATLRTALDRDPRAPFAHGGRVFIDERDRVRSHRRLPWSSPYFLIRWPWMHQETCLFRRSAYEAVGGIDTSLGFALDYDLFSRMLARAPATYVDRPLGGFRWHAGSKTVRLFHTVGVTEIAEVRRRRGATPRWFERPIGTAYSAAIRWSSRRRRNHADWPPVGVDLKAWWEGRLGTGDPIPDQP